MTTMQLGDVLTFDCSRCGQPHIQAPVIAWTPCWSCSGMGTHTPGSGIACRTCRGEGRFGSYSDMVVAQQERHCAQVRRLPGERFRLSDVDKETGRRFCDLRFVDLPELVQDLVLNMGVSPERWNALVERGEVLEVPCLDGVHSVSRPVVWGDRRSSRTGWPGAARVGVAA